MDPRLLGAYNQELRYFRELGGEFAKEFPKVASRIGLEGFECADPYIERLLEGVAFLTARVQLKLQDEYGTFTSQLLETVYPHFNAPTPSLGVVRIEPEPRDGSLEQGFAVPRGTALRTPRISAGASRCEYRTAHEVRLWPLEVAAAEYLATARDLGAAGLPDASVHAPGRRPRAAVRLEFRRTTPGRIAALRIDHLDLYLQGPGALGEALHSQMFADAIAVVVREPGKAAEQIVLPARALVPLGLADDEALLPTPAPSFGGYRLLQEYFAFPDRYRFARVDGLRPGIARCPGDRVEVFVLFDRADSELENTLDSDHVRLHCTPVVNLFPKRCDRVQIDRKQTEHQVLPDRTRPLDYEVHTIVDVRGHEAGGGERAVLPVYCTPARSRGADAFDPAWYTIQRSLRLPGQKERRQGGRSTYAGTEVYLSIVDGASGGAFDELSVQALCTNRDLPLLIAPGQGRTDLEVLGGEPVRRVHFLAGPTRPREPVARESMAWKLIGHLTLNHLSLTDEDELQGAVALRELLGLYGDRADPVIRKQVDAIRSVRATPVVRRLPISGPVSHGRGLEITLVCDEGGFDGSRPFLLGSVLERFFARYVSINSFTETVLQTTERGVVARWPRRIGRRTTL